MCLGFRVERTIKIGLVCLEEAWSANWVGIIVCVDATGGKDSDVNALQEAAVGQVQGANDIVSDGILLVILAPVDIGSASGASSVEDVCRLDSLQFGDDGFAVLHADCGGVYLLSYKLLADECQKIGQGGEAYLDSREGSSSDQQPILHHPR